MTEEQRQEYWAAIFALRQLIEDGARTKREIIADLDISVADVKAAKRS